LQLGAAQCEPFTADHSSQHLSRPLSQNSSCPFSRPLSRPLSRPSSRPFSRPLSALCRAVYLALFRALRRALFHALCLALCLALCHALRLTCTQMTPQTLTVRPSQFHTLLRKSLHHNPRPIEPFTQFNVRNPPSDMFVWKASGNVNSVRWQH
jgi:hypothetical protein